MKQTLKQPLKVSHLWIILAIMAFGAIVYYADQIPVLKDIVTQTPIQLARYSTHRILSIIPVAYAAFIFRLRGGAIITAVVSLGLLPRALLISSQRPEALAETAAFFAMGIFVSWLIDRQQQSLRRLEKTQLELMASLKTAQDRQHQLQLSEERYRGLFENAGEAIFVCSTDGKITSANNACELLTGYDHDSLMAKTIYGLFSGESEETVRRIFSEGLGGRTISGTDELR